MNYQTCPRARTKREKQSKVERGRRKKKKEKKRTRIFIDAARPNRDTLSTGNARLYQLTREARFSFKNASQFTTVNKSTSIRQTIYTFNLLASAYERILKSTIYRVYMEVTNYKVDNRSCIFARPRLISTIRNAYSTIMD